MNSPLKIQTTDLGIRSEAPKNARDPRVRLAPEDALQALINLRGVKESKKPEWLSPVAYTVEAGRKIGIKAQFYSGVHHLPLSIDTKIILPPLPNQQEVVNRLDRLYLVNLVCIVGAAQDQLLGQVTFAYKDRSNPQAPVLVPTQKENARRYRSVWLLVVSQQQLTGNSFELAMPEQILAETETPRLDGSRYLPLSDIGEIGQSIGSQRIYARDSSLVVGNYEIVEGFTEVAEICQVRRIQNQADRGFTYGAEIELDSQYSIQPIAQPVQLDLNSRLANRLEEVFAGKPGKGKTYARTVQNLIAGLVAGNPGRAGEAAAAPNGSPVIGNSGRITFTNQAFIEKRALQVVTVQIDGTSGSPVLTVSLPGNSPNNSTFSQRTGDHLIYAEDGTEQSVFGRFINTGNGLTWLGTPNSSLQAGQLAYVVASINYPAGSGFTIPFEAVETVWVNGTPIGAENIRYGEVDDITEYIAPANGSSFFAVMGRERAALHYLLQRVDVTANVNGIVKAPAAAGGVFAFIDGLIGRIDKPIVSGLIPNTAYSALVYYAPKQSDPVQIQMRYCPYQGIGSVEGEWLDDAMIVGSPICYITTQGGGNSVFAGDAETRFVPIGMHLPQIPLDDMTRPYYLVDAPMQIYGETYNGAMPKRQVTPLPGAGLAIPAPGMRLRFEVAVGLGSGRSLNGKLMSGNSVLGCRSPLIDGRKPFILILAFIARKAGQERMVVMSRSTIGNENIAFDTALESGFDTFLI